MKMEAKFKKITQEIKDDPMNQTYTQNGIDPLYYAASSAEILIVGQAPGKVAEQRQRVWDDISGDHLREWMGIDRQQFYNSGKIAVLPMDFYFPGKGKGGDLPPRKGFADKWHPQLIAKMPQIKLTILVGSYSIKHYLNVPSSMRLTDIVKDYQDYLPQYFPLVHPSPRNKLWMKNNPWFETDVLPHLKQRVNQVLK